MNILRYTNEVECILAMLYAIKNVTKRYCILIIGVFVASKAHRASVV